jgi:hypothetical protein
MCIGVLTCHLVVSGCRIVEDPGWGYDLVGLVSHPVDRYELQTRRRMSGCRIVEDPVRSGICDMSDLEI